MRSRKKSVSLLKWADTKVVRTDKKTYPRLPCCWISFLSCSKTPKSDLVPELATSLMSLQLTFFASRCFHWFSGPFRSDTSDNYRRRDVIVGTIIFHVSGKTVSFLSPFGHIFEKEFARHFLKPAQLDTGASISPECLLSFFIRFCVSLSSKDYSSEASASAQRGFFVPDSAYRSRRHQCGARSSNANIISYISIWMRWHQTIWDSQVVNFFLSPYTQGEKNILERAGIEPGSSCSARSPA